MWDFRRALCAFPVTGFSRDLSSFLSDTCACTHTLFYIFFFLFLPLSLFLSCVRGNTSDILDSNSIARFSQEILLSKWLCPISSPRFTISRISLSLSLFLSRTCPLVPRVRFQFQPQGCIRRTAAGR